MSFDLVSDKGDIWPIFLINFLLKFYQLLQQSSYVIWVLYILILLGIGILLIWMLVKFLRNNVIGISSWKNWKYCNYIEDFDCFSIMKLVSEFSILWVLFFKGFYHLGWTNSCFFLNGLTMSIQDFVEKEFKIVWLVF